MWLLWADLTKITEAPDPRKFYWLITLCVAWSQLGFSMGSRLLVLSSDSLCSLFSSLTTSQNQVHPMEFRIFRKLMVPHILSTHFLIAKLFYKEHIL